MPDDLGAPDEVDALSRLDERNLVVGQPVEFVDKLIDLPVWRIDQALAEANGMLIVAADDGRIAHPPGALVDTPATFCPKGPSPARGEFRTARRVDAVRV